MFVISFSLLFLVSAIEMSDKEKKVCIIRKYNENKV